MGILDSAMRVPERAEYLAQLCLELAREADAELHQIGAEP